jgi:hypothetical protein
MHKLCDSSASPHIIDGDGVHSIDAVRVEDRHARSPFRLRAFASLEPSYNFAVCVDVRDGEG